MLVVGILIGILIIYFFKMFWMNRRPPNFPPGPKPLPIIGNIHQMQTGHLFTLIEDFKKEFGSIIGFMAFGYPIVWMDGVDNILEALRREEFQSRPNMFGIRARTFGRNLGLFFGFGEQWSVSRKFTIKHLRAFGKKEKENLMADEINQLMEKIKGGETIQADGLFGVSAVNVIWLMMANKRMDQKDESCRKFLRNLFEMFRKGSPTGVGAIENFVPLTRFFNPNFKFSQKVIKDIHQYMRETIQEHRELLDPNNPIDFIDCYLVEMEQNKHSSSLYSEEELISIGMDLFTAGAESTSNSIEFILMYLVLHPHVQVKLQEELDRVLCRSRKPNLDDKSEMHYTMAVITEVERLNSIAPTNAPHVTTKDATFNGFFFPKGTLISMNLRSLGSDPKYWKNPEDFYPERFLDADGKFVKPSNLVVFGLGHRSCVGEIFARNTIFLGVTTFFEKFSIRLPPGDPKPSTMPLTGFTTAPQPFRISVMNRY